MAQRPVTSLPRVAALAVALVLAVVLARARAAGLTTPPPPDGVRELVRSVLQVVAITVLTAAVVLLLTRYRHRPVAVPAAGERRQPPRTAADRRRTLVALLMGLGLAVVAHVLTGLLDGPSDRGTGAPPSAGADVREPPSRGDPPRPGPDREGDLGDELVLALLLAGLGALAVMVVRDRALERVAPGEEPDEEEAGRRTVARAVRAGRDAVRDSAATDPREAIVACFAAMEDALADRGAHAAPRPADTPEEVLTRGVAHARLPEAPARTLLGLFREARFSTHPMAETDREAADRALAELLAGLGPVRAGEAV